jgi:cytochrome P450
MTPEEAGRVFVTPTAYADEDYFHAACATLRREAPVHRVEGDARENPAGFPSFWAITKHADVQAIESQHAKLHNAPMPVLENWEAVNRREEQGQMLRTLIHMDEPDHRVYRQLTAVWFQPAQLRKMELRMAELAKQYVDNMAERGGRCDFARDIAVHYPLSVILSVLGLPESDFPRMLSLTQELFGSADPDLQRGNNIEDVAAVIMDFFKYFGELTAERRANPTDDLSSVIANAQIDGRTLDDMELISYYVIIATAGHDTTSSSISGGLHALLQFPDQMDRLRADPSLMGKAVDEMIRWVTPVKHFMRTASEDTEIRGVKIAKGDPMLLSYPSANRDEDVFTDPMRFDAGRDPNRHLAFGFGAHYCLGAQLARMEAKAFFAELLPRLRSIELDGEPAYMQTLFVGGPKRLPVRYELN